MKDIKKVARLLIALHKKGVDTKRAADAVGMTKKEFKDFLYDETCEFNKEQQEALIRLGEIDEVTAKFIFMGDFKC